MRYVYHGGMPAPTVAASFRRRPPTAGGSVAERARLEIDDRIVALEVSGEQIPSKEVASVVKAVETARQRGASQVGFIVRSAGGVPAGRVPVAVADELGLAVKPLLVVTTAYPEFPAREAGVRVATSL
jgi:hypothetical protein